MATKLVGVDIGASMVRVVEVAGVDADGFAMVTKVGLCPLPEGVVVAGRIRSPKEVSVALLKALREAGVPRQGFVLGLSSPDVAVTTMAFPASVRASEREGAVRALARPISTTFSLDESILATYRISTSQAEGEVATSTVGVGAVHQDDFRMLQAVCELARCAPRAIDLSGAALLRALTRVNPLAGEVGTVVDVGASKVLVATRQGMFLRSLRTTVGGGADVTRALANTMRVDFPEAEQAKMTMRLSPTSRAGALAGPGYGVEGGGFSEPARSAVDVALASAVDLLVDSVAQSIESDAAAHGSTTQGVSLCGGSVLLRGFKEALQQRLGLPVNIGRPWADLERSKRNAAFFTDGRPDPKLLLSLSTAVGLALWREAV